MFYDSRWMRGSLRSGYTLRVPRTVPFGVLGPLLLIGCQLDPSMHSADASPPTHDLESPGHSTTTGGDRHPLAASPESRLSLPSDFFVENIGQVARDDIRYYHASGGLSLGFLESGLAIVASEAPAAVPDRTAADPPEPAPVRRVSLLMTFESAAPVAPDARDERPHTSNYFVGAGRVQGGPARHYGTIVYEGLYPGIDLVYTSSDLGPKYMFLLEPGADPQRIRWRYEGIEAVSLAEDGGLALTTALGTVGDSAPTGLDVSGRPVDCHFRLVADLTVGLACPEWSGAVGLVIDPLLASGFLGGGANDTALGLIADNDGGIWVAGQAQSPDFPTTTGVIQREFSGGATDAFVARLSNDATTLLWATYLGGSEADGASALALGPGGDLFVAGTTRSANFPTSADAYVPAHSGRQDDGFVARLTPDGQTLAYATLLGGAGAVTRALDVVVDNGGSAHVTGSTTAANFPISPGVYSDTSGAGQSAFLVALTPDGNDARFTTVLRIGLAAAGRGVAVDETGVYVVGVDFGLTTLIDVWALKVTPGASGLVYNVGLVGPGSEVVGNLAVDAMGSAYLVGHTGSDDFSVMPGSVFPDPPSGGDDIYVVKLDPTGSVDYARRLGGSRNDFGFGIGLDGLGGVVVTGETASQDFPTKDALYADFLGGDTDAVIVRLDRTGGLVSASYLGGSDSDRGTAAQFRGVEIVVAGSTRSNDFVSAAGAPAPQVAGGQDGFVVLLTLAGDDPPPPLAISAPPDVAIACDSPTTADVTGNAVVSGGCDGAPNLIFRDVFEAGRCANERTLIRSWTAEDACGRATAEQIIQVSDTTAPTLTLPADAGLDCADGAEPPVTGTALAVDNCDPSPAIAFTDVIEAGECPEAFGVDRLWQATDACGNRGQATQQLAVFDERPPALMCPANITVPQSDPAGTVVDLPFAVATDACDQAPSIASDAPARFAAGETLVTFTAVDSCANSASCESTVTVVCEPPQRVDFESLVAGTRVHDQISGVSISARNKRADHPDVALVFNSHEPTGYDSDLGTPGQEAGGPGRGIGQHAGDGNDVALGNLLIIAENDCDSDGDGRIDDPDDEALGGELIFDFAEVVAFHGITIVDAEEEGGTVAFYLGDEVVETIPIPASGDNSVQHLDLTERAPDVTRVVVHLAGSGALDELVTCAPGGRCCASP